LSFVAESSFTITNKVRNTRQITFGDRLLTPWICDVYRVWEIEKTLVSSVGGGSGVAIAAAVPRDMRESYFIAYRRTQSGSSRTTVRSYQTQFDAITYSGWRNLAGFTGFLPLGCAGTPAFPACWSLADHPEGCGKVTYRSIWEELPGEITECSLTSGSWASPCQNIEAMPLYPGPPPPFNNTEQVQPESRLVVTFVAANIPESLVTWQQQRTGPDALFLGDNWFTPSPDDGGNYQNIHAYGNELGSATTVRYSRTIDDPPQTIYGSPAGLELREGNWVFVGVMNA
jgi:hypothetical protein